MFKLKKKKLAFEWNLKKKHVCQKLAAKTQESNLSKIRLLWNPKVNGITGGGKWWDNLASLKPST